MARLASLLTYGERMSPTEAVALAVLLLALLGLCSLLWGMRRLTEMFKPCEWCCVPEHTQKWKEED
jgi:hypothetical protein